MNAEEFYNQVAGWSIYSRQLENDRKEYLECTFKARSMRDRGDVVDEDMERQITRLKDKIDKDDEIVKAIAMVIHEEVDRVEQWKKEHPRNS